MGPKCFPEMNSFHCGMRTWLKSNDHASQYKLERQTVQKEIVAQDFVVLFSPYFIRFSTQKCSVYSESQGITARVLRGLR
jgi:hypothetical protein